MKSMTPFLLTVGIFGLASGWSGMTRPVARHAALVSMAGESAKVMLVVSDNEIQNSEKGARLKSKRSRRNGRRWEPNHKNPKSVSPTMEVASAAAVSSAGEPQQLAHRALARFLLGLAMRMLRHLRRALVVPWRTRRVLRDALSAVGAVAPLDDRSIDHSIVRCTNDYELVTRTGKELEHILEEHFKAPPGKGVALPVKIRCARTTTGAPLSLGVQKRMTRLVRTRNALVHRRHESAIRHRAEFVRDLDVVLRELASEISAATPRKSRRFLVAITGFRAAQRSRGRAQVMARVGESGAGGAAEVE